MMRVSASSSRYWAVAAVTLLAGMSGLAQAPAALSAEGSFTVVRVSPSQAKVGSPRVSSDGRYVAFLPGTPSPGHPEGMVDLLLRDRLTGGTTTVWNSTAEAGQASSPRISADGRFVAFEVAAARKIAVFVYDREDGNVERVSVTRGGAPGAGFSPAISGDGRRVTFMSFDALVPKDTNGDYDIYVRNRVRRTTRLVSVSSTGRSSNGFSEDPVISADGRYVAFASYASNLVPRDTGTWDVFVRDLRGGTTRKVSVDMNGRRSNSASREPSISATGRFIAFTSSSSDLVARDTNDEQEVFVRDMVHGVTERVAVSSTGRQADNDSVGASISRGGRYVAFSSWAGNLVPGDTNGTWDAFLHDRRAGTTRRVSVSSAGEQGNGRSYASWVSPGGRYVGFSSQATNLVPGEDLDGESSHSFLWDRGRR